MPDETPQVFYESVLPEVQDNEGADKERASSFHATKTARKWLWSVMALLIIAAIVIGVAIGIWRHRKYSVPR